jgi:ubiquinone/menaquinone biosynthesis C-methylase UbiE
MGTGTSGLTKAIREFGRGRWLVVGMDFAELDCDARMDARFTAFRNETFDQIFCISTIEHIGVQGSKDARGDRDVMEEISRILKKKGTAIVSVPYGKNAKVKQGYRIYDHLTLAKLAKPLAIEKKEFYRYSSGKWIKCSETTADQISDTTIIPLKFHSAVCACLLLKKTDVDSPAGSRT